MGNTTINQALINSTLGNVTINQALINYVLGNVSINQAYLETVIGNITIMNGTINFVNRTVWINYGILNNTIANITIQNAYLENIDGNLTIVKAIVETIDGNVTLVNTTVNTIYDLVDKIFNHLVLNLYNNITGLGIDFNTLKVYVNGTRMNKPDYYTLHDIVNVTVLDFFNRTIYSAEVPTNGTWDIPIPIGELTLYNNNTYTILVNLTAGSATQSIILKPNEAINLELVLGDYIADVYRVVYSEATGEVESYEKLDALTVRVEAASQDLNLFYGEQQKGITVFGYTISYYLVLTAILFSAVGYVVKRMLEESEKRAQEVLPL